MAYTLTSLFSNKKENAKWQEWALTSVMLQNHRLQNCSIVRVIEAVILSTEKVWKVWLQQNVGKRLFTAWNRNKKSLKPTEPECLEPVKTVSQTLLLCIIYYYCVSVCCEDAEQSIMFFYICTCYCTQRILRGVERAKNEQDRGQNPNPHAMRECAVGSLCENINSLHR